VDAFNEALKIEPHHGWALNNIAEVELKLGKVEVARKHFQLAIVHDPESPDAHWGLAVILEKDVKPEEADAELKKGNALSKDQPKTMEKLREDYLPKGQ
jgi:tetratricopeptide (TPR) repeat protein